MLESNLVAQNAQRREPAFEQTRILENRVAQIVIHLHDDRDVLLLGGAPERLQHVFQQALHGHIGQRERQAPYFDLVVVQQIVEHLDSILCVAQDIFAQLQGFSDG